MIMWQKFLNARKFGWAFRYPWEPIKMGGVNFAFFSRHASRVRLELFDHPQDAAAARVIDLDPERNRTGEVWHIWVEGIGPGQLYAYRVDGPYQPPEGHRFDFHKLLLDPFVTMIARRAYELYERRGRQSGQADQDWLQAEREITAEAKP